MISLCMITKNEQRCISRALKSVKRIVDEMVIVDTGSTDGTIEIIKSFIAQYPKIKVKLLHFDWVNDFSKARNFAIDNASGSYILSLDADEFISDQDLTKFQKLRKKLKTSNTSCTASFTLDNFSSRGAHVTVENILRLFPNLPEVRFQRAIHEDINPSSLARFKKQNIRTSITIMHDGYDPDLVNMQEKNNRNLNMLNEMIQKDPSDYVSQYYFGRDLCSIDIHKGIETMKKVYEIIPDSDSEFKEFTRKMILYYEKLIPEDTK